MFNVIDGLDLSDMPEFATRLERNPRTKYYEVRWTEEKTREDGKIIRRTRTFSTRTKDRKEAEKVRHAWAKMGAQVQRAAAAGTVAGVISEYTSGYLDVESIGATQRFALKQIVKKLGGTNVTALDASVIAAYRSARTSTDGVTDGTVRRELSALSAALTWCRKNGRLPKSFDAPLISLPPESAPRLVFLSDSEERRLWALASTDEDDAGRLSRIGRFVCLALAAPARSATIESLTWDRVHLSGGWIDYRVPGKRVTRKRQVPVPVSNRLKPILLRAFRERDIASDYVLDHPGTTIKLWQAFADKHGFSGVTRHDLRRTWASLSAMAGVSMVDIAAVLGDTLDTTIKHYAHLSPDHLRTAVNARR